MILKNTKISKLCKPIKNIKKIVKLLISLFQDPKPEILLKLGLNNIMVT